MAGVYSTRFILGNGAGPFRYSVPLGKRAIVRSVTCFNGNTFTAGASASIAGTVIWYALVPGSSGQQNNGLFIVVNAQETLEVGTGGGTFGVCVSGQLLDAT